MNITKILYLIGLVFVLFSCKDDEGNKPPTLTTKNAVITSDGTVILHASLEINNNAISSAGFEYGTSKDVQENKTVIDIKEKPVKGDFEYQITSGLLKKTTYYYRAFVETDSRIYGEVKTIMFNGYTPTIDSLSNNDGQIADTLVIFGRHFYQQNLKTKVDFSGDDAALISLNDSIIKCIIPSNLKSVTSEITVTVEQMSSNSKAFMLRTPNILKISPGFGFDGSEVIITGENFSIDPKLNKLSIQGIQATVLLSKEDEIKFKIPKMEFFGETKIVLTVGPQTISSESKFNLKGPKISNLSINEGHSGNFITVEGENFTQNGSNTEIYFEAYAAEITEYDSTFIKAIIPIPMNSLLNDYTVTVKIVNGLKSTISSTSFKINKSWESRSATPFSWSWKYNAFSHNNLGYILEVNEKRLYSYDPITDSWKSGSSFPGNRDENNLFIVNGNKLLKLGGINYIGEVNEFWEYNFNTESWIQLGDLPFTFNEATYFELNGAVFIITNQGQVWSYDYSLRLFTRRNNLPTTFDGFGFAFNNNGEVYFITYGSNWEYDLNSDTWIEISKNQIVKESYFHQTFGFYANNKAYVLKDGEDLYKFDTQTQKWILTSKFPGCRSDNSYKTVFVIDDLVYVAATSGNYSGCSPLLYQYRD